MQGLKSVWTTWKHLDEETDLQLGRDERYYKIEGDAYRIAARTIPITMLVSITAGLLWLPETISRETILQLAFLVFVIVMGVFWLTVRVVMERQGASWVDPAMPPGKALLNFILFTAIFLGFTVGLSWIRGEAIDVSITVGMIIGWGIWFGIYTWRWRNTNQRDRD